MRKLVIFNPFQRVMLCTLFSLIISTYAFAQCPSGSIEGNVFLDYNFNGVKETAEEGESGVFVRVYNSTGSLVTQSMTDSEGNYSVDGLNDGEGYLFEVVIPDNYLLSASGPQKNSEIQFVTSPACDVDLGILNSTNNCTNTTELILSCFANGLSNENPDQETIIGIGHNFNATSPVKVYATNKETGSVWGMTYNANTHDIYSAAFVKQHASLSPHGHDAIFVTHLNGTPSTELFAKLSDLGQTVGTLNTTATTNCNFGKQAGRIGLGGLDIDDDNKYLYVANLHNNTIVKIDTENPVAATTQAFAVPNPGCSFNDFRVFAVKYHTNKLYVGVTCTAETSQDADDTSIHVYSANTTSGNFSLEFSTEYSKGVWVEDTSDRNAIMQWLTDIEFTDEGNMVLGISDRKGHTFCRGTNSRVDEQAGDILLVENQAGTWVLENNGSTSSLTGTGVGNGEGPGGGEFFGFDHFPTDKLLHPEVALGAIASVEGTGQIVAAVFDPIFNSYSGGLHRYNTTTGEKTGSKELYNSNITAYFGKATGFGDIIAVCGNLPAEAGNLLWVDADCDGNQTAGEAGMSNITLDIYDADCQWVGSTITDDYGRYAFNRTNVDNDNDDNMDGLVLGSTYYVALDATLWDETYNAFIINDKLYFPTSSSGNVQLNSDIQIDNAVCPGESIAGMPVLSFVAESGNNSALDIGLKEATDFDLALRKTVVRESNYKLGDIVEFEITVYNQGDRITSEFEITDYLTSAYNFEDDLNEDWVSDGNKIKKTITTQLLPNESYTEVLRLSVKTSMSPQDYVNYAEISWAKDIDGELVSDIDSAFDDVSGNDKGGLVGSDTDDLITDDGSIDEDDHDPARIRVLDLALMNVVRDVRLYDVEEEAIFDMTVYNQGNVAVSSFELTNLYADCMSFTAADNAGWTSTMPGFVKTTVNETLEPGESTTVSLKLKLTGPCAYEDIINRAEISAFTSTEPGITKDIDSEADDFLFNDNGGNPYDLSDNMLDGDGTFDEDDHDPALIAVRKVDLALMKTTENSIYSHGDIVNFEITLYNQGDVSVGEVMVVDYLPEHTTLVDNTWKTDVNDPTGRKVYKTITFDEGFNPGEEYKLTIDLSIDASAPSGEFLINEAEIGAFKDRFGINLSYVDIDSDADSDPNNDMGGELFTDSDDNINDDGNMDEDDHDPSGFLIADLDVVDNCTCLNEATAPYNGLFETEIVITSLSGQTWTVDEEFNLYDITSTPDNLVSLAGYTLSVNDLGNNLSEYTFTGVFVDGERYEVRFTNGFGTYLQASGGGPDCTYNRPIISSENGLSAVCAGLFAYLLC